jgi:hypothetical protein
MIMPKFKYRPQNKFGRRYLTARELGGYAEDLKLTATAFPESYFEFLEQERLLLPVCRVRFPVEIVRQWELEEAVANDEVMEIPPCLPLDVEPARLIAATTLKECIRFWPMDAFAAKGLRRHALDDIASAHAEFIEQQIADLPFQSWETFRILVGYSRGRPRRAEAVFTYYHYWQVFLLAQVQTMQLTISVNLLDEENLDKLLQGKLSEIPSERLRATIPLGSRQVLREFPQYHSAFDTLAYFWAYRERALEQAGRGLGGGRPRLTGKPLDAFLLQERTIATEAMARGGMDTQALLGFVKWQCQRWQDWDHRGQPHIAEEYKRNISRSAYLYRALTGMDFDQIAQYVGHITGHRSPTLEVIFPNWIKEQKETGARSLKHWIKPTMSMMAPLGYDVSDADCDGFFDWLEGEGLLQFFWHVQRFDELGNREDLIGQEGLAKEIEGLATTLEHLLNHIGNPHPTFQSAKAMFWKVKWVWGNVPDVVNGLLANSHLTGTGRFTFRTQIPAITDVTSGGPYVEIVRDLLKIILIRNQGVHLSLRGFDRDELYQLLEVALRSAVIIWKHAKKSGLI